MLLQSQDGVIHLLPALPGAWQSGSIKGLRARGSFEVDITWRNHQLDHAVIKSLVGGACSLRTARPIKIDGVSAKSEKTGAGYITTFVARKGMRYTVVSR